MLLDVFRQKDRGAPVFCCKLSPSKRFPVGNSGEYNLSVNVVGFAINAGLAEMPCSLFCCYDTCLSCAICFSVFRKVLFFVSEIQNGQACPFESRSCLMTCRFNGYTG